MVHPSCRRKGYGRVMLDKCEEHSRRYCCCCYDDDDRHGVGVLYLCTADQVQFYTACGYDVCDKPLLGSYTAGLDAQQVFGLAALYNKRAMSLNLSQDGTWMCKYIQIT